MKKFLSLVLALVMTMSLVTISAGAKEFTDDDTITYDEAINVISTIGVVDGYADGSFRPTDVLTRGAAAKIICNLILGPTTAAELHATTAPFKDVPTSNTFAGYIAYCAKEGIISGYADGTFRPSGTLTGYAFMKMLLGALGYDAEVEGYTGANWSINVAKQAINIGLNNSLVDDFNGIQAVTRQEACLYAFNTLQADLVEYETIVNATINGETVNIGNSIAKARTFQNSATRRTNIKKDNIIQFAEQYFPKLELTEDIDVFGRPDREWEFEGKDVGTYVNYDLLEEEYTEKVTGLDLYTLLGKSTLEDYDTTIYIDGITDRSVDGVTESAVIDINKNNKEKFGATGDGVLTQVFVDSDSKEVTIAIINTYLAIASKDYDSKKEEATFKVYGVEEKSVSGGKEYIKNAKDKKSVTLAASIDDFDVEGVQEDDAYLVNIADGEIQIMAPAEIVEEATISAFKIGSNVTADGTKYDYADTAVYDEETLDQYTNDVINLKEKTYDVYLDAYGYLIGVKLVEDDDNYVFITGIDSSYSNLYTKNVDAAGIFTDGTMDTIRVNTTKSTGLPAAGSNLATVNRWYTYTVSSDGVYTLKEIKSLNDSNQNYPKHEDYNPGKTAQYAVKDWDKDIDKKNVYLPGGGLTEFNKVYGNDSTVYLTASIKEIVTADGETDIIIDDVDGVTVGIKNANIEVWDEAEALAEANDDVKDVDAPNSVSSGVYTLYKNNGYIIATVVVGEDAAASKNLVYAHEGKIALESYDTSADEWTWTRKVIYQGEEITIKEVGDSLTYIGNYKDNEGFFKQYEWFQVKYNANGEVISVEPVSTALEGYEYVTNIALLDKAVDEEDTVLYSQTFKQNQPSAKSNVLYVNRTINSMNGFHVSDDVKVALIQYNKNKEETTYYTGYDELEDIVETLNKEHGSFNYTISAIIEGGDATVVVIRDEANSYNDWMSGIGSGSSDSGEFDALSWDKENKTFVLRYYEEPLTSDEIKQLLSDALGEEITKVNQLMETVTTASGDVYNVDFDQIEQVALYLDGVIVDYADKNNADGDKLAIPGVNASSTAKYLLDEKTGSKLYKGYDNTVDKDHYLYTAVQVILPTDDDGKALVSATLTDKDETTVDTYVAEGETVVLTFTNVGDYTVNGDLVRVVKDKDGNAIEQTVEVVAEDKIEVKAVENYMDAADIAKIVNGYEAPTEEDQGFTVEVKSNTVTITLDAETKLESVSGTGLINLANELIEEGNTILVSFEDGGSVKIKSEANNDTKTALLAELADNITEDDVSTTVTVTVTNTASGQSVVYKVVLDQAEAEDAADKA